jgi:D-beta-D-heptose 7-phosphate kinase/D-beta-D-heptose 1-phosphate adenosyltransferase
MTDLTNTQQPIKYKILLVGDDCIDEYQYGTVDRLSPEAPVPVFRLTYKETKPGMAGNVKANLEALCCKVTYLYDKPSIKTRLIDSRSKQHIVRIDNDIRSNPLDIRYIKSLDYDSIIISDYDKGTVSYELIEQIIEKATCPVFIDTKKTDLERMQGAWVKINELEYSKIKSECSGLIVTLGNRGAEVPHHNIRCAAPKVEVVDVTGAGDTFLSALAIEYLNTTDLQKSIEFAIRAATVTVQHQGVYAPTREDLK